MEYLMYFRHGAVHAIENNRRRQEAVAEHPQDNNPPVPGGDYAAFEKKLLKIGALLVLNNLFKEVAPFEEMITEGFQLGGTNINV